MKRKLEKDPLDLALEIKRGFEKTVASSDKPAKIDGDYLLIVAAGALAIFVVLLAVFWPDLVVFRR